MILNLDLFLNSWGARCLVLDGVYLRFSCVFFEWVEGGNKSSKLSSGGGTTDLTGLHIESN